MERRGFCLTLAAACPALALLGCERRRPATKEEACALEHRTAESGRVLDPRQWAALEAACARLLPTDQDPGATEANVVNFIDGQLSLPHFQTFQRLFRAGIEQLDRLAARGGGSSFVALSAAQQDRILSRMERGVRMGRRRSSKQFFRLLLTFTLEGFLGDPVYGGNKDRVGWRFIGFEPRPPRPRCPYLGR